MHQLSLAIRNLSRKSFRRVALALSLALVVGLIFAGLSLAYLLPLMIANFAMLARLLPRLAMGMGG